MKSICLILISFYQRYISPKKGFRCAHNALHQSGSCSYAIKGYIQEKGLFKALPDIRNRFSDCRQAYQTLCIKQYQSPKVDLPCDLPCDMSFGSCSSGADTASSCYFFGPCDPLSGFSRKTQRRVIVGFVLIFFLFGYWFYGRAVGVIYIEDKGAQQSIFKRLSQRENPKVRLLLEHEGEKYYSDIVVIEASTTEYKFRFSNSPLAGQIDNLKVLDARVNIGNDLVVLGQVLEEFKNPKKSAIGERFSYRIKRRWHFF